MNITKPQQLIYEMEKFSGGAISVICGSMLLNGNKNPQEITTAINELYKINDALRIRISETNGNVQQTVSEYTEQDFEVLNFNSKDELDIYAQSYAMKPLDLYGSLCEFKVVVLPDKYGCLVKLHHMIGDAWTLALFGTQLNSILNGDTVQAYSYADYIESEKKYLDGKRYEKDRTFFLEQFKKCDEPTLLNEKNIDSLKSVRKTFVIEKDKAEAIKKYCSDNNSSPFMLFMSTLAIYMNRIKMNQEKFYIGTAVLNRSGAKERNTAGMFINTVPLLIELDNTKSFSENISALEDSVMSVFRHQKFNYGDILKSIRQEYNFTEKLYDVMLSYQNAVITGNEIESTWYHSGMQSESLQIHIDDRDNENIYRIHYDYQTDKFSENDIFAMHSHICKLLFDAINNSGKKIYELEMLSDEEYQKVIFDFNDTVVDYPREKCIHELFEEQARKTPDKIALVFEDKQFTYKQLDEMSNSLAHYLREEKNIQQNDIVPIIAKRSWHIIVATLGVLKAGGAYMPVDPTYPLDRISFMTVEAKSKIALTFGYKEKFAIDTVSLDNFDYNKNIRSLENHNTSSDLCYLITTSGSTGKPKATMQTHFAVRNYSDNNLKNIVFKNIFDTRQENIVSVTNFVFDIFVTESLMPILHGLTIYFANDDEVASQSKLAALIENNAIDVMQTTPTKMHGYMLDKNNLDYLRKLKTIILGGEALPTDLYEELSRCTEAEIYNIYGPAETTVWSTNSHVESIDITIGKPIANTQIYILDKNRKPLPIGVAGELCISGDGVGKGYLNRPELTAEKFIPNPFYDEKSNPTAGKIMYCTGDLARWRADGEIEYLGRIDTQVKIRGLRIELGEIESVMSTFDGINMTAVTDKRDENNRQYLVGYYTAENAIDEKSLRQHLSAKLPKYMVPNYFVHLSEMPMTASGKTDRKNLPLPDFTVSHEEYVAPETETEIKLSQLWGKLLKLENVGKNDDFYELGGDSLMAITLLSHIENEFNVNVTMKDILENSVLENLAKCIENSDKKTAEIVATGVNKYALLPQQKAIYAVCSKEPDTLTYNMPTRISLNESIDRDKIKACFEKIIQKHSSLRTCISAETDNIFGIVNDTAELVFEEYSDENYMDYMRPFDLSQAPLMRIGFTETSMLFDMHHIIADGESLNIILSDLAKMYLGTEITSDKIKYADYAEYFKNADFSEHKAFYKDMLKCDFEPIILPEKKNQTKSEGVSKIYSISKNDFENAKKYAHKNGLTDTMLFLGAFGILLSKYTAKSEVLTSVVLTNRTHRETQDIVGMFVNTLPIFMNASGETETYYAKIKDTLLNMFEYQELPFTEIAEAVGMTDKSVVNTSFVYQANGEKKLSIDGIELAPEFIDTHTSKFDITFEMTPNENGCAVRIEYNSGKYEESLINKLFKAYTMILEQLEKEKITDISVLSEDEYQKVIFDFNDTAADYPREKCIHELFEEQARKNPKSIALKFGDNIFTFAELNSLANGLAMKLQTNGVVKGDVVAIISKRSYHIIVAMLAIFKCGAAYLPIDYNYPTDRINTILTDAGCRIILTYNVDYAAGNILQMSENIIPIEKNIICDVVPKDICGIIYTSGSTGTPKGTLLHHQGLVNYTYANNALYEGGSCNIGFAIYTFDAFFLDLISPMLRGKTAIMATEEEQFNQIAFENLIKNNPECNFFITPAKFKQFINNRKDMDFFKRIHCICIGGEVFPQEFVGIFGEDTKVYNVYGPTECSMWMLEYPIKNKDVTLGKPMSNVQVYILDKHNTINPIGVTGELCIAGDGVGAGYLNRPELTEEKFINNPFGKGKLYKTGDLAYWREDGNIVFVGRNDYQVKIRGLRIELGEIESVMSTFDGVNMTAVTDKRDENNRQYLVGYYTAETEIDEKSLRQHLSAKLPKYMVPNYFVHLSDMPMTASGKTDRKNLPLPDFTVSQEEYVAPETETEIKLCNLLAQLFEVEKVGVTDDFFDIGGDSLRAIEYVAKAHNLGVEFALQNVFDYPTVKTLCNFLINGAEKIVRYNFADFEKYVDILEKNQIDESFVPQKQSLGNVLLTGATGFLGAHVLDNLMQNESGKIYCLVRSNSPDDRRGRWPQLLNHYFGDKYDDEIGKRIIPVVGDITKVNLSDEIPNDVQTVIHTAATVKHYGSYQYFYDVNVQGTKNVVDFAKSVNAKMIHISTLSVSGNSLADEFSVYRSEEEKNFYETSLFIGQPLDNVYIRSKFEAEMEVLDAVLDGLEAKIIRVGNLTNRLSDSKFQPNYESNAFLTRFKAAVELGMFPEYLLPLYAEFSPIDQTAEGVVKIAQYADKQCVFHLNSNRPIYFTRLLEVFRELEIKMELVSGEMFNNVLQQIAKDSKTEYIYEAFQNDMDENGQLIYDTNIRIINDFTDWFMKKVGFEWAQIDFDYIKSYVEYFRNIGYLEV